MKFCSIIALALAVLVSVTGLAAASDHATAGTTKTTTTTTSTTTTTAQATNSTASVTAGTIAATLEAYEYKINDCFKTQDTETFMSLVEANGWMANANGFSPVSDVPEMMKQINLTSYTIQGFKAQKINPETYLVTYTYTCNGTYKGQAYPTGPWYCSSVWNRHGSDWKAAYHQESLGMMASNGDLTPKPTASMSH